MERDRPGNGAAGYAWTVDELARERISRLEEHARVYETRLDAIEQAGARRQGSLDNMAGIGKVAMWFVGIALAGSGVLLSWLNISRH